MSLLDKMRTQKLLSFTLVVFTLCIGIVIGTVISANWHVSAARESQVAPGATPLVIPNPVELSTTFSQIAKQVEPAVVAISTSYTPKAPTTSRNRRQAQPNDEDQGDNGGMEDFFNRFFGGGSPFGPGTPQEPGMGRTEGLGSGVVVDPAGYILTNNHVVEKADRIKVKFAGDVREYDAKVVGTDEQTDLAVVRVEDKKDLHPAKIGNSDAVQVGDWVVAIGSPFGFQATVTAGIISAKERDVSGNQYQHFLQTDAAINPGNSGGPLLNIRGELIGINTAIASRTGGNQGIGFALPINTAAEIYNQIIKTGKVTRSSIGIQYPRQESQSAANLRFAGVNEGVFVTSVQPDGPADKAGIQPGDVIVSLNGKPVRNGSELVSNIVPTPVGTPVTLGVVRDGKRQEHKVVTGDIAQVFPEFYGSSGAEANSKPEGTSAKFGISIQNLTEQWRQGQNLKQTGGVRIVSVEPDSFAEDAGLLPNDVIVSINRKDVNSADDVTKIQATLKPGDPVQFRVLRKGLSGRSNEWTPTFVAGELPKTK
jgi:serine protease Do